MVVDPVSRLKKNRRFMIRVKEIDLYITNKCNLRCPFCSVEVNKEMDCELTLNEIKTFIGSAKEMGLEELHLTGGEPLLRKDVCEIVKYAVDKQLNVRLITNGTLMTLSLFDELYNAGLRSIMFSLDGLLKYNDSIRSRGSFSKTIRAIKICLEKSDMIIRANSVAWVDNMQDIKELLLVLNELKIDTYSVFLGSPLGHGRGYMDKVINPLTWQSFIDELKDIVRCNGIKTNVVIEKGFLFKEETDFDITSLSGRGVGCFSISSNYDYFLVRANGHVYPCVFYSNSKNSIGNIRNNTLKAILMQYKQNSFYNDVGKIPAECLDCSNAKSCRGGCRGYAQLYTGKWTNKDIRCSDMQSDFVPLCPIMKYNLNTGKLGGSSEEALKL